MNKELLELLITTPAPSGYEINLQKKLIDYMKSTSEFIDTYQDYTVVHGINKNAKTKILLCAHIDEIGLVVTKINSDGTVKVTQTGGIRPYCYIGQHVRVLSNGKEVPGVITYLPNMDKGIKTDNLILDIGARSKEEALSLINVGDACVHMSDYSYLANNMVAGRALDDKLAVYIYLELLKRLKGKTDLGIYVALTPGEETTGRGAKTAVAKVDPTFSICCDVTYAADVPYGEFNSDLALGKGPVITKGSLMNSVLHEMFIDSAKRLNMNVQLEIASSRTYTDSDSIFNHNGTTPTYLVSIPLRYMHSAVEVCQFDDVEQIIDLFEDFILNFKEGTSLDPFKEN